MRQPENAQALARPLPHRVDLINIAVPGLPSHVMRTDNVV